MPVIPEPGAPFDPKVHQLPDANTVIPEPALIAETLAAGYAFQGQMVRPALVSVQVPAPPPVEANVVPSLPDPPTPPASEASVEMPATDEPPAATPAAEAAASPSPEPPGNDPPAGTGQPQLPF